MVKHEVRARDDRCVSEQLIIEHDDVGHLILRQKLTSRISYAAARSRARSVLACVAARSAGHIIHRQVIHKGFSKT
jgi:hypothetical protein